MNTWYWPKTETVYLPTADRPWVVSIEHRQTQLVYWKIISGCKQLIILHKKHAIAKLLIKFHNILCSISEPTVYAGHKSWQKLSKELNQNFRHITILLFTVLKICNCIGTHTGRTCYGVWHEVTDWLQHHWQLLPWWSNAQCHLPGFLCQVTSCCNGTTLEVLHERFTSFIKLPIHYHSCKASCSGQSAA